MPESPEDPALTTAYTSNTRTAASNRTVSYDGNATIRRLLIDDYSFLPVCYRSPGFLFRGLSSGLRQACDSGQFGLNHGTHALAHLERDLGVHLVSADFSDAYTVSRLWECGDDGVILILRADYFSDQYQRDQAATLGFAEPGVVFKYPFFCNAINLPDVAYFIVTPNGAESVLKAFAVMGRPRSQSLRERLIVFGHDHRDISRQSLGQYLKECLADRQIDSATMIQVESYPQRSG